MAQYDQLPVFKKSYDLLLAVYETAGMFGREFKYTLGENMKKESLALIVCIYKANSLASRAPQISEAKEHLEIIRLHVRISKDLKQMTLKKMIFLNEFIESISKQLTGWEKAVNQNNGNFNDLTNNANFWSSSQNDATNAWNRNLNYNNANVNRNNNNKTNGFSGRCLKV